MFKTTLKSTVAAIAMLATVGSANAMTFSRHPLDTQDVDVFMQGKIVDGDAARFSAFLSTLPAAPSGATTYLDLDSPGGNLGEAFEMVRMIAKSGASTVIHSGAKCASACFFMFAAGQHLLMSNNAELGVHSPSDTATGAEASKATVDLARDSHKLGIPDSIVVAMIKTPPDDMTWLSPKQLTEMGVTIVTDRPVTAMASPPAPSYTPASAPAYTPAPAPVTPPAAASADPTQAFAQGERDRRAYEAWFASLADGSQFKQGAFYWASVRSTKNAAIGCIGPGYTGTADQQQWAAGCQNAKAKLGPTDYRRLTSPAYRDGWNSVPDPTA